VGAISHSLSAFDKFEFATPAAECHFLHSARLSEQGEKGRKRCAAPLQKSSHVLADDENSSNEIINSITNHPRRAKASCSKSRTQNSIFRPSLGGGAAAHIIKRPKKCIVPGAKEAFRRALAGRTAPDLMTITKKRLIFTLWGPKIWLYVLKN